MSGTISKTLVVKAVGFKCSRYTPKDWKPPHIDNLVRMIFENCPTTGDRHYPPIGDIEKGASCAFLNKINNYNEHGVLFDVCSYSHGMVPESLVPDFSQASAEIVPVVLQDNEGKRGELVANYRCYAIGSILIVEMVKGSGGTAGLVNLLNKLARRVIEVRHPLVELSDIGSSDLNRLIDSRGGVKKVTAKLVDGFGLQANTYGETLADVRAKVPNANSCLVTWEADSDGKPLGTNEAVNILEEAEDNTLTAVTLHFVLGGSISDLSEYKERKSVSIQLAPDGRPAVTEIEAAMKKYLNELRDPKKNGPIYTDGRLKKPRLIGEKK
ncbi:hypothetical protein [Pseudomonas kuykendallii]|uniref:hypothetical protein n=1 Tax=Pseudomonas kuykendallii TaxID=1007099 RepID=UPI002354EE0C|nr:hypothetical protein [Pseudomonas kuykendallii]